MQEQELISIFKGNAMNNKNCVLCDVEITRSNDSNEHIIPQAIGGRRTISGFICAECNNITGSSWEKKLAEQLSDLCLITGIKRQRRKVPGKVVQTESKRKLFYDAVGSMTLDKNKVEIRRSDGNQEHVHIRARNMDEAEKLLENVRKKYPADKYKCYPPEITEVEEFCDEMMHFQIAIGGSDSGRSIVKSALAMATAIGVDPFSCEQALKYLRSNSHPCFGYYYETDLVRERVEGTPYHIVSIKGIPCNELLLGYVEFFGCYRMVVCLSENYTREIFQETYALNPVDGNRLNVSVDLDFDPSDISKIYNYEMMNNDAYSEAIEKIIAKTQETKVDQELKRRIGEATEQAFRESGIAEGAPISPEQMNNINNRAIEIMAPYITHLTTNRF